MSVFKELLAIKEFRQNKAEMAVSRSRLAVAESNANRDAMDRRLTEFRTHAEQLERDWYKDLCARIVKLADIEDVQLSVSQLRQKERVHEEALEAAEKARQQATEKLHADVEQLNIASRLREKFVELADAHAVEVDREAERKEDLELEEVAGIAREREEWGSGSDE